MGYSKHSYLNGATMLGEAVNLISSSHLFTSIQVKTRRKKYVPNNIFLGKKGGHPSSEGLSVFSELVDLTGLESRTGIGLLSTGCKDSLNFYYEIRCKMVRPGTTG